MASGLEGTYKSLLQGVSQQVPRLRLEGQVETQDNMLADPVTSIRRRPGTSLNATYNFGTVNASNLYTQYLERGSDGRNFIINTSTGQWWILNSAGTSIIKQGTDTYFKASGGSSSIQTTSVGGELFVVNVQQAPRTEANSSKRNPDTTGWFFVKAGAFDKVFNIIATNGGATTTVEYTTPNGQTSGDAAKTSPAYIANELAVKLRAKGYTVSVNDRYLYIAGTSGVTINSSSGTAYVGYSGRHNVPTAADLPAKVPSGGNGILTSVGTNANALVWYRWDEPSQSWQEDSAYGSPGALVNMPRVVNDSDQVTAPKFEGRLAGDDKTNEAPSFITNGAISGITTYQGRLVILSGAYVSMSKSGNAYRFYRSTVTELESSDRIDIGIGSSQNSILRRGIQFNRDLVLLGDSVQAVITGNGTIITPQNAAITITSEESCVSKIAPIQAGQTVLYPFKRSTGYSGMLELIPSQYTTSQYISQDATGHIPEYIAGDIRFATASNVVNMCVVAGTGKTNELYVHEYQWSTEGKQQAAWHRWIMPTTIASAHFAREKLMVFSVSGSNVYSSAIDPREGYDKQSSTKLPYLDLYSTVTVSGGSFGIPAPLRALNPTVARLGLAFANGTAITEEAGIASIDTSNWTGIVELGVPDGLYWLGIRFRSAFTPTPPILKDENGKEVGSGHVRLVRMEAAVRNTGMFDVHVVDARTDVNHTADYTGLFLNSPELVPNYPLVISQANVLIPCRTLADTTLVTFSTSGTHDMNLLDISYILRFNQRRRRV